MAEIAAIGTEGGAAGPPLPGLADSAFLESLVLRVSEEYGASQEEVRNWAVEIHRSFANARVQSFVPILVEKKLRASYRSQKPVGPDGLR